MSLPSSGTISMSQINTEAGFSSTTSNSSTENRTFNYAAAGVDQNRAYSFSEFYSKTYTSFANSDTLYCSYWYDGGQTPNNAILDGWCSSADAAAHTAYVGGGPYYHTVYWNGTLGNGTQLYINGVDSPAIGYGAHTVDSNYGYNGGAGCASPYYHLSTANATFQSSTNGITYYSPTITITNFTPITTTTTTTTSTTTTTTTSSYTVYFDIYVDVSTGGGGAISVCATSDSTLSHSVGCSFYWSGDLSGTITDTLSISSGFSCASATYYSSSASPGENTVTFNFTGVWPTSYGSQVYAVRNTYITNTHPC